AGERWNEAMQLAVELNFAQNLAAIGFEGSAEVVELDAAKFGHQPICCAARNLAHEPVVAAGIAPAADEVVAFFDFFEEFWNLFGIMLQIAVHRNDDFTAREIETGFERGCLAKVTAEADEIHAAVVFVNVR